MYIYTVKKFPRDIFDVYKIVSNVFWYLKENTLNRIKYFSCLKHDRVCNLWSIIEGCGFSTCPIGITLHCLLTFMIHIVGFVIHIDSSDHPQFSSPACSEKKNI